MTAVQDEDFTDSIERELKRQNKDGKKVGILHRKFIVRR